MCEVTPPPKLTRSQAKQEICLRTRQLLVRAPAAWHGWDWEETHQFNVNAATIKPEHSLPKVMAAAKFIARCYGVPEQQLIPEGVTA